MSAEMRAAVYHAAGDIRIERIPRPRRADDEILVRVLRSGLCGTDVTEWRVGPVMIPLETRHPHSGHQGPMVPGHEFIGEVVEAPAGSPFAVGTRVASGAQVFCGECRRCAQGRYNICERLYTLGLNAPGGHAEYVAGPPRSFVPIPPDLPLDVAGLAQPLAVGLHAARRAQARAGDRVLVSGAGAIGSFVLVSLRHLVPDLRITVVDVDPAKLERSRRLGADETASPEQLADHDAFDLSIEASGAPGTLAACIHRTAVGGRVLAVGMPPGDVSLPVHELVLHEITLETTVALVTPEDIPVALEILGGTGLADELLDSVRPLSEIAATLDELAAGQISGKVLLDPGR
ncbi:MAG: alcohol dehydrogenase catalytic domain-containing protein [Actinomycetales bacterium]|nr:alcohol dehydrogenase catalytic domain-containing protein [Actinomycetales bacterium]